MIYLSFNVSEIHFAELMTPSSTPYTLRQIQGEIPFLSSSILSSSPSFEWVCSIGSPFIFYFYVYTLLGMDFLSPPWITADYSGALEPIVPSDCARRVQLVYAAMEVSNSLLFMFHFIYQFSKLSSASSLHYYLFKISRSC